MLLFASRAILHTFHVLRRNIIKNKFIPLSLIQSTDNVFSWKGDIDKWYIEKVLWTNILFRCMQQSQCICKFDIFLHCFPGDDAAI